MSKLTLAYTKIKNDRGKLTHTIIKSEFNKFNPIVLGLGDISAESKYQEALVAVFDLEGFSSFCNQIDPHLVVPEFLQSFLTWLFENISKQSTQRQDGDSVALWCQLPFFAKFTGDGVLFLWDTVNMNPMQIGNVVCTIGNILASYTHVFIPEMRKAVAKAPKRLRCGIARGQVVSVGNGEDYVGACINVASRIQKLSAFSLALSRRGFSLTKNFTPETRELFKLIRISIRGVGDDELVFVPKEEFDELPQPEQQGLSA